MSQVLTVASFGETDVKLLKDRLAKAQRFLDQAKAIAPDNPEILVQQAMIHTAWIAFDGASYGMQLSPKVSAIYQKAETLAPDNPRVVLAKAEWEIGNARYFGKPTQAYCKDIRRALELFATFKAPIEFYPEWGRERAAELLADCDTE